MKRLLNPAGFLITSVLALGIGLVFASPVSAQPITPTIDDVGSRVICMCGCGSVLNNCIHQECMERDEMRSTISLSIKQGKSADEIVNAFVFKYGEEVLAAPTKKGFNLTAWITPFLAILIGGIALFFILKAWVLKGSVPKQEPAPTPVVTPDKDQGYRQQVEEELKQYGERL